jgi:hypothetical protein
MLIEICKSSCRVRSVEVPRFVCVCILVAVKMALDDQGRTYPHQGRGGRGGACVQSA